MKISFSNKSLPKPPRIKSFNWRKLLRKTLKSSSWAWILGLIIILFAVLQHEFVRLSVSNAIDLDLKSEADQVLSEAYRDGWKMEGFRQADLFVANWHVITKDGQFLDVTGFLKGLVGPINPRYQVSFDNPTSMINEAGETWRLMAHRLDRGYVVAGAVDPEDITKADEMLMENLKRFGSTQQQSLRVKARDVDSEVSYAVIDASGEILLDYGGVPLQRTPLVSDELTLQYSQFTTQGEIYRVLRVPIVGSTKWPVGIVLVYRNITLLSETLRRQFAVAVLLAVGCWTLALIIVFRRVIAQRGPSLTVEEAIEKGEGEQIEFKASFEYDIRRTGLSAATLRREVIKTVAAFLNTKSGQLFIGVNDDGTIRGIAEDLRLSKGSWDKFQLKLGDVLSTSIDKSISSKWHILSQMVADSPVCIINVDRSSKPAFVKGEDNEAEFYVRAGNKTQRLDSKETYQYIEAHFGS